MAFEQCQRRYELAQRGLHITAENRECYYCKRFQCHKCVECNKWHHSKCVGYGCSKVEVQCRQNTEGYHWLMYDSNSDNRDGHSNLYEGDGSVIDGGKCTDG